MTKRKAILIRADPDFKKLIDKSGMSQPKFTRRLAKKLTEDPEEVDEIKLRFRL